MRNNDRSLEINTELTRVLDECRQNGVRFEPGMTADELRRAEEAYGFTFPASLREILAYGVPVSENPDEFPRWRDFSDENVTRIRQWMQSPAEWLKSDIVRHGFWLPAWGERPAPGDEAAAADRLLATSPLLIPVSGHRFMPVLEGCDNPPVISTVGCDTILYGGTPAEYLRVEFLSANLPAYRADDVPAIPLWDTLIFG